MPHSVIANDIQLAQNLSSAALLLETNSKPLVLFVTASDCHYCEQLRENIFQFLPSDERFILREVVMDSSQAVIDFDGQKTTHRQLSKKLTVNFSPTVLFLGNDGETLSAPLVGVLTLDYYRHYFEQSLKEANHSLIKIQS